MKKMIIACAAVLAFAACKQPATLDPAKVKTQADSAYNAQKTKMMHASDSSCAANMGKMVEEKADSIVKASKK
jgi:hypothetical protein